MILSPCAAVDLTHGVGKGFAIAQGHRGIAQFLLIPTARIGGIEDPGDPGAGRHELLGRPPGRPGTFVEERLHTTLPRDAVSLAINSVLGRTQNQLHIHIDCVRPDVRDILAANSGQDRHALGAISGAACRPYLPGDPDRPGDAGQRRSVSHDWRMPARRRTWECTRLALIGATFADGTEGFVLLDDHADPLAGDLAHAEELQDHTCALATK